MTSSRTRWHGQFGHYLAEGMNAGPYCDFCLAEALSGTRPIIKTGALKAYKIVIANPEAPATFACYMTDATLRRGELLDYDGRVWNVMNRINRPG